MSTQTANTALVTGASSGIGATYAERLARRGHDLVLVARDLSRLEALAGQLSLKHGVRVEIVVADLNQREDLAAVETQLRGDERISMLINNAGVAVNGPLLEADPAKLEAMIQLNSVVATRLALAAAEAFAAQGHGTIVNMGSVTSLLPERFNGVYAATKAYLLTLSQSLAQELAPRGVRVQAVLPGVTRTPIWEHSGMAAESLPAEMIMEVGDMVDAALAGLDQGETVTIPSLPDAAEWDAYTAQRLALGPNLSHSRPAARYGIAVVS